MGSFSVTCAVSGLPVCCGDRVRYFLLFQNPEENHAGHRACYPGHWWFPRTFPLKAIYNDYGSVEEVEEGICKDLWLEGFKKDLVEKGWGDNSCHDVPARKDWTFEELLEAVWENRVEAKLLQYRRSSLTNTCEPILPSGMDPSQRLTDILHALARGEAKIVGDQVIWGEPYKEYSQPVGVPTLHSIERFLRVADLPVYHKLAPQGYMVDNLEYGIVRVRWHNYEATDEHRMEMLEKAQERLKEQFATVITPGRGYYAHKAELILTPKPGTPDVSSIGDKELGPTTLQITQAMVLEEVWEEILKLSFTTWRSKGDVNFQSYLKATRAVYTKNLQSDPRSLVLDDPHKDKKLRDNPVWMAIHHGHEGIPPCFDLRDHWLLFLDKKMPVKQAEPFLQSVAEMFFLEAALSSSRFMWKPSPTCGPQIGEYEEHVKVLDIFKRVAEKRVEERKAEDGA